MSQDKYIRYRKKDVSDRQIDELIGISKGILADERLVDEEILFLHQWAVNCQHLIDHPLVRPLYDHIAKVMEDGVIDEDERRELRETLEQFAGEKVEFGEIPKTTTLPVDRPAPQVIFEGRRFCMTGTFIYGNRTECEAAVKALGGTCGAAPTLATDYVVLGTYVTASWKSSNHGRKIQVACKIRDNRGKPLAIITEEHWRSFLPET